MTGRKYKSLDKIIVQLQVKCLNLAALQFLHHCFKSFTSNASYSNFRISKFQMLVFSNILFIYNVLQYSLMIESKQIQEVPTVHIISSQPSAEHIAELLQLLQNNSIPYSLQQDTNSLGLPLSQRYFVLVDNIKGIISLGPQFSSILMFIVGYPRKGQNKKNHYCKRPFEVIQKYQAFCELPEPQKTIIFTSKFRSTSQLQTIKSISRKTFSNYKTKSIDRISQSKSSEKVVKPLNFRTEGQLKTLKPSEKLLKEDYKKQENVIYLLQAKNLKYYNHYEDDCQYNVLIQKISSQDQRKYIKLQSFQQFTAKIESLSNEQIICFLIHQSSLPALLQLKDRTLKRMAVTIYTQNLKASKAHEKEFLSCSYVTKEKDVRKELLKLSIVNLPIRTQQIFEYKSSEKKSILRQKGFQTEKRIKIGRGISFYPKSQFFIPNNEEEKGRKLSSSFQNDKQQKQGVQKDSAQSDSLKRSDSYYEGDDKKVNKKKQCKKVIDTPSKLLKKIQEYFPECSPIKQTKMNESHSENYSTITKIINEHVPIKLSAANDNESKQKQESSNKKHQTVDMCQQKKPGTQITNHQIQRQKKKIRLVLKGKQKNQTRLDQEKNKANKKQKRIKSQHVNPIFWNEFENLDFPQENISKMVKKRVVMPQEYYFPSSSSKILPILSINEEKQTRVLRSKTQEPSIKYGSYQMIYHTQNQPYGNEARDSLKPDRNNHIQDIQKALLTFTNLNSFQKIQLNEEKRLEKTRQSLEELHMQTGRFVNSINFGTFGDLKNLQLSLNSNRHQSIVSIQNKQNSSSNKIYNYSTSIFSQPQSIQRKNRNSFGKLKNCIKQQLESSPFFAPYRSQSLHFRHKPYCILYKRNNAEISQLVFLINKKLNERHSNINVRKHEFKDFKDLRNIIDLLPGQSRFIIFSDTEEINEFALFLDAFRQQKVAQFEAYGKQSEQQFISLYLFGNTERESLEMTFRDELGKQVKIMREENDFNNNQITSQQIVEKIERNSKRSRRKKDRKEYMSSNKGAPIQIL